MTFRAFRHFAADALLQHERCSARGTALFQADQLLLRFGGAADAIDLTANGDKPLTPDAEALLQSALSRLLNGEPLQYVLGEWDFYGIRMYCGPGCLIPRPETEILAEYAIKALPKNGFFLDLCTGSGCIAAALLTVRNDAAGVAVDLSEEALTYARRNNAPFMDSGRLSVECCDAAAYVPQRRFDLILSNPPYIKTSDLAALPKEVAAEPRMALDGGPDGLSFYRLIARRFPAFLNDGGVIALEAGFDTAHPAAALFADAGFSVKILPDLSGINRFVIAEK